MVRIRRRGGVVVQDCDVYIGRAMSMGGWRLPQSIWHNPFPVRVWGRQGCLDRYREYLEESPELLEQLPTLCWQTLGCWCAPEPCHGDILAEYVRQIEREIEECGE